MNYNEFYWYKVCWICLLLLFLSLLSRKHAKQKNKNIDFRRQEISLIRKIRRVLFFKEESYMVSI